MCYAKPAPRCSRHAFDELKEAREAFKTNQNEKNKTRLEQAEYDYSLTPRGLKEARDRGDIDAFVNGTKERERLIALAKQEEQIREAGTVEDLDRQVELAGSDNPDVREALLLNPNVHSEIVSVFEATGMEKEQEIASLLTDANSNDWAIRKAVARNPSTPAPMLSRLAGDEDERVRVDVARNPSTPADALERLAGDEDEFYVRRSVARNPSTPADALERLAGDENERVRQGVARNPSTPADALERLAGDEDERVRQGVARNPSTPAPVLLRLADDKDLTVREGLVANPNYKS